MALTVFFSWQVDRDGVDRAFIERALKDALKRIEADAAVEPAVRQEGIEVDRDTKGVAGTPPIVDTIFAKIDRAAIFVPDLTFVAKREDGRPSPNPNVLIEYGWALKSMGHSRMMPVMNIAHGKPTAEAMPFDMRHLRNPIQFDLPPGADADRKKLERDKLSKELEAAIRTTIESGSLRDAIPKPPPFPAAEPKEGQARFRSTGSPLGMTYPHFRDPSREVFLASGPAIWLRMMPTTRQDREWEVPAIKKLATEQGVLMPLGAIGSAGGLAFIRADDGFGVCIASGTSSPTRSVVFVFRSGEVWTVDSLYIPESGGIALDAAVSRSAVEIYSSFLKAKLGIPPPYQCLFGIEGVKGKPIFLPNVQGKMWLQNPFGACVSEVITTDAIYKDGDDPAAGPRRFFSTVYERCGVEDTSWLG